MPVMVKEPLLLSDDDILGAVYEVAPLKYAAKLAGLVQLNFHPQARLDDQVMAAPAALAPVMDESKALPQA